MILVVGATGRLGGQLTRAVSFTDVVERVGRVLGRELPAEFVPLGSQVPLVPPLWDFLYALESFELELDMSELPARYRVRMTSVADLAEEMFGSLRDAAP